MKFTNKVYLKANYYRYLTDFEGLVLLLNWLHNSGCFCVGLYFS